MRIRDAREADLPRLLEIYNHYIEHTPITFDLEPQSLETRRVWFDAFDPATRHRLFVVTDADDRVEGYASSRAFRVKAAYDRSVETSIYLAPECVSKGLGSDLYAHLLTALEAAPLVHRAYAGVTVPNEPSEALHQKLGFKRVGTYSEVGFKFGRYWDVAWFERSV